MQRLDANRLTEQQFLDQYNPGDFPRPSVAADIVIFSVVDLIVDNYRKLPEKELQVLLIRRGGHPYIGQWALPGGFVRPSETVGEAANRELYEETGIRSGYLEQLYTFSQPGRDPRTWVISCAHMALINSNRLKLKAGTDADDARWFTLKAESQSDSIQLSLSNEVIQLTSTVTMVHDNTRSRIIENNGLAFDHAMIIAYAIQRLRAKMEYTDLAFSLLPERFTLTELQRVYEIVLGKPLLKAAFRRKIKDLVIGTDEYTQNAGYRPSQIFIRKGQEKR